MKTNETKSGESKNWMRCPRCERHNAITKWCWHCGHDLKPFRLVNTPGMFEAMALLAK